MVLSIRAKENVSKALEGLHPKKTGFPYNGYAGPFCDGCYNPTEDSHCPDCLLFEYEEDWDDDDEDEDWDADEDDEEDEEDEDYYDYYRNDHIYQRAPGYSREPSYPF